MVGVLARGKWRLRLASPSWLASIQCGEPRERFHQKVQEIFHSLLARHIGSKRAMVGWRGGGATCLLPRPQPPDHHPLRTTTTTSSRCRNTTKPRPTLPPRTNGAKIAPPGLRRHLQPQLLTFPAPVQPSLRARLSQPWPRGSPEAWRWSVAMPKGGRPAL